MFIAALFTIAKTQQQLKRPSADEWMDTEDVGHICNGTLLSQKKNKIMPFAATQMKLEIIILSEVTQKKKDKYHMQSLICEI